MVFWQATGLVIVAYLLLLARSAWKQGEIRQFLVSLAIVVLMIAVISGIVAVAILFEGR